MNKKASSLFMHCDRPSPLSGRMRMVIRLHPIKNPPKRILFLKKYKCSQKMKVSLKSFHDF